MRAEVIERLEERREEIEEAIVSRAFAVSESTGKESAEYILGLRAAITAAVDYGFSAIEHGAERAGPTPAPVLTQARKAARNRIGLEVVLRRYAGGYSVLGDFLHRTTLNGGVGSKEIYALQRELTALFDRLVAAVSAEYQSEAETTPTSSRRLGERVRRLLAGEIVDTGLLGYDLEGWHLGIVASGPRASRLVRERAACLDSRLLLVSVDEQTVWAWLGGRRELDPTEVQCRSSGSGTPEAVLAVGEPGLGPAGWRLTHRQAEAAMSVARRRGRPSTCYAEVALLTAVLRDPDLEAFLTEAYLTPLATDRDGGKALRQALRAYLGSGRNVSAAAAALGISRQTVASRLQSVERRIGRQLNECGADLEAILDLSDLDA